MALCTASVCSPSVPRERERERERVGWIRYPGPLISIDETIYLCPRALSIRPGHLSIGTPRTRYEGGRSTIPHHVPASTMLRQNRHAFYQLLLHYAPDRSSPMIFLFSFFFFIVGVPEIFSCRKKPPLKSGFRAIFEKCERTKIFGWKISVSDKRTLTVWG